MTLGLVYKRTRTWGVNEFPQLEYYSDASFADHVDTAQTQGGFCARFPGQAVSTFVSRLAQLLLMSTYHAEMHFASMAGKDIMYKRALFAELGFTLTGPTKLHVDNAATILDGGAPIRKFPQQSKHFRLADRLIHEPTMTGAVKLIKVPGTNNVAGALTKPLPAAAFRKYNAVFHGV